MYVHVHVYELNQGHCTHMVLTDKLFYAILHAVRVWGPFENNCIIIAINYVEHCNTPLSVGRYSRTERVIRVHGLPWKPTQENHWWIFYSVDRVNNI